MLIRNRQTRRLLIWQKHRYSRQKRKKCSMTCGRRQSRKSMNITLQYRMARKPCRKWRAVTQQPVNRLTNMHYI